MLKREGRAESKGAWDTKKEVSQTRKFLACTYKKE